MNSSFSNRWLFSYTIQEGQLSVTGQAKVFARSTLNRLGGVSLGKSVVRLTDRPNMTLDVYYGRKTTTKITTIQLPLLKIAATFTIIFTYFLFQITKKRKKTE